MSIGAELPPAPVQCPMCRRFVNRGELHDVVAKAISQPVQEIVVCGACHHKVATHGTVRCLVHGEYWCIGLPEGRPIPSRK